jgi:hypothetical protein
MPLKLSCPQCRKALTVPDQLAGRTGKCPGCGASVSIPPAAPISAPQPPKNSQSDPARPTTSRLRAKSFKTLWMAVAAIAVLGIIALILPLLLRDADGPLTNTQAEASVSASAKSGKNVSPSHATKPQPPTPKKPRPRFNPVIKLPARSALLKDLEGQIDKCLGLSRIQLECELLEIYVADKSVDKANALVKRISKQVENTANLKQLDVVLICSKLAKAGFVKESHELSAALDDMIYRDQAKSEIVINAAASGRWNDANELQGFIQDPSFAQTSFCELVGTAPSSADLSDLLEETLSAPASQERSAILTRIAKRFAHFKDADRAYSCIEQITGASPEEMALAKADAFLLAGIEAARMGDTATFDRFYSVADKLIWSQRKKNALPPFTVSVLQQWRRSAAYCSDGKSLPLRDSKKSVERYLQFIDLYVTPDKDRSSNILPPSVDTNALRLGTYLDLAVVGHEVKDVNTRQDWLNKAIAFSTTFSGGARDSAVSEVLDCHLRMGLFDEALSLAEQHRPNLVDYVSKSTVWWMCRSGDWRSAEHLRRTQSDPDFDGTAAVIRLAASEGWFDPCQESLSRSADPVLRCRFMIEAIRANLGLPVDAGNRRSALSNWTLFHELMLNAAR